MNSLVSSKFAQFNVFWHKVDKLRQQLRNEIGEECPTPFVGLSYGAEHLAPKSSNKSIDDITSGDIVDLALNKCLAEAVIYTDNKGSKVLKNRWGYTGVVKPKKLAELGMNEFEQNLFDRLPYSAQKRIYRDDDKTLRFRQNKLTMLMKMELQKNNNSLTDMNSLWELYNAGFFNRKQLQKFYQDIGYTLEGYFEIWGDK